MMIELEPSFWNRTGRRNDNWAREHETALDQNVNELEFEQSKIFEHGQKIFELTHGLGIRDTQWQNLSRYYYQKYPKIPQKLFVRFPNRPKYLGYLKKALIGCL